MAVLVAVRLQAVEDALCRVARSPARGDIVQASEQRLGRGGRGAVHVRPSVEDEAEEARGEEHEALHVEHVLRELELVSPLDQAACARGRGR